jgi:phage-related minor tail protein
MTGSTNFRASLKLDADAAQYTAELTRAGQTTSTFTTQVQGGGAAASTALQGMTTAAQSAGAGLQAAGQQGAQGLQAMTSAAQASQGASTALLAVLRDQVAVSGLSAEGLLRYRAAQAGVAAEAAPLILQLQNQRAAQAAAAEAARAEEAAQRANAAAKQQAAAAQENFLASLRDQAAVQGKSQVELMRYRAAQLGVAEGAEPYIRALEQGAGANMRGALSAREHAMAMRMLPMQMTDVVTSVASGMPIWMVAIQQGGQIKDSFGGFGATLRALLGSIKPVAAGMGLLGGAAALGAVAYNQGSREADGYRKALVMTGNAAGTSVGQMSDMARAIGQVIGTQGKASEALTEMAGSGAVAAGNLQRFTEVALGLDKYVGIPVANTVAELTKLGKAPLQASVELNEKYHHLTASVYEQIKALQDQGRTEEAAVLAQQAYVNAFEARKNLLVANLGIIERAWNAVSGAAKSGWDAILNIGRAATTEQQLDEVGKKIEALRKTQANGGFASTGGGAAVGMGSAGAQARERELQALLAQQAALEKTQRLEKRDAEAAAERAATAEKKIAWDKAGEQFKDRAARRDDEIRKAEVEGAALVAQGLLTEAALRERIAAIRERYKDPKTGGAGAIKVTDNELATLQGQLQAAELYHQQLLTLGTGAAELNAGERESIKIGAQLERVTDAKTAARLREKQAIADALGLQLRDNAGLEQSLKTHQASIDGVYRDAQAISQRAREQEAANAVFGKGRTAIEQMTLATLEHQLAEADSSDSFDPQYVAGLREKIAAQKDWVAALQGADYKAAEQHVDELLRNARALATVHEQERGLAGLTALERDKIVARRAVELKYAKELAAIDAQALSDVEKQALRAKALEAQRLETAQVVAQAEVAHMDRAAEEINRSLTDALMRGFEAGKGFAENLVDTTKNLFNSLVLRPTISAIVTPIAGAVNGLVQQGLGALGLGGGGGGSLGLLSNASSAVNLLNGGSLLGSSLAYGAAVPGLSLGGTQAAMLAAQTGAFGSAGLSATAAAGGSALGGTMGALGAAMPWLAAGGLLLSAFGGKLFGRTHEQHNITGTFGGESGFTGNYHDYYRGSIFSSSKKVDTPLEADRLSAIRAAWAAQEDAARHYAETLGLATNAIDGFSYRANIKIKDLDPNASDYQAQVMARVSEAILTGSNELAEQLLGSWSQVTETVGKTVTTGFWDDQTTAQIEETTTRWMYSASAYAREGERAIDTLTRLGGSLGTVNTVLDSLNSTLLESTLASGDRASKLLDVFGGGEQYAALAAQFRQDFYSPEEVADIIRRQLTVQLEKVGVALPTGREAYRDQVEAAQTRWAGGDDAAGQTLAVLMQLSGAFAQIQVEAPAAAAAVASVAMQFADTAGLADVIQSGLLGELSAQDLGGAMADVVIGGVYDAIAGGFAQQITQLMLDGVVTPMLQAAVAGAGVSEAVSQAAIDKMVADATAAAQALGTLLASADFQGAMAQIERAMYDMAPALARPDPVYVTYAQRQKDAADAARAAEQAAAGAARAHEAALRAEADAQEAAAREAQKLAEEAGRLAQAFLSEQRGLTRQIWELQGNQAALRADELAALQPGNRALQERIYALRDAAQAEQDHAAALREARGYLDGVGRTIQQFISTLNISTSRPAENYDRAWAAYRTNLTVARGGDRDALGNITSTAGDLIEMVRRRASSGAEADLLIARIRGELADLPERVSAEQLIVDAIESGTTSQNNVLDQATLDMIASWHAETAASVAAASVNTSSIVSSGVSNTSALATAFNGSLATHLASNFAAMDTSLDGLLTFTELQSALSGKATDSEIRALITRGDANADGMLSRLEVLNLSVGGTNAKLASGVTFSPDNPTLSLFQAIKESTAWLTEIHGYQSVQVSQMSWLDDIHSAILQVVSRLSGVLTVQSNNRVDGGWQKFAAGGVFTNSIVSAPTAFNLGLMGEAGPEAIMPLARGAGGQLGVRATMGGAHGPWAAMLAELAALRAELALLRADANVHAGEAGRHNKRLTAAAERTSRNIEMWERNGPRAPREVVRTKEVAAT